MTRAAHWLVAVAAAGVLVVSCIGDDTSDPVPSAPSLSEQSAALFDQTVMHTIAMEISERNLDRLDPPTDDRVPVDLTVDGETARDAGVRIKQGA